MWVLDQQHTYVSQRKKWQKKHKAEWNAVHNNLDTFFKALQKGQKPASAKFGFIHRESEGLLAVDQSGAGGHALETRLYVFPDEVQECLFVIIIGDKDTQQRDIATCREFLKSIRKGDIVPTIAGEKAHVQE